MLLLSCGDGAVEPAPPPAPVATTVAVNPGSAALSALGETARFTAEVRDQSGQVMTGAAVAWASSDASVATVDASGLVTAVANGSATITATSGSASASATVRVDQEVNTVAVTRTEASLAALGDTVRLTAEALDANGQPVVGAEFSWGSSDSAVATVDASGLVTAVANGSATITATSGSVSGIASVVVAQEVSAVAVTPDTATVLVGDTLRLAATATDANGQVVTGVAFAWASGDTAVAVVDASGLLTGVGAGQAQVTATAAGVTGRAQLTVVAPVPTTIAVTPDTVVLTAVGQTEQLTAQVHDQLGRVMDGIPVAWSSADTTVAVVGSAGLVTAVGGGAATVTGRAGEAFGDAFVTVMQSADSVTVTPPADTIALGDTLRLVAKAYDESGHVVAGAVFTWSSSNAAVATVDSSGLVRGVGVGTTTITATVGDASGTSAITVTNPDRAALVSLYNATDGPNWFDNTNWLTDAALSTWHGVRTDEHGRVSALWLPGNGLTGNFSPEVGNLENLTILVLESNQLTGPIPSELGNLVHLRELWLPSNRLSGPVPPELGNLLNLTILSLSDNQLTGPIPSELGNLRSLKILDLSENRLTGPIPSQLGQLARLTEFWLGANRLTGPVPAEFGNLTNLTVLALGSNQLSGPVPRELLDLRPLEVLYLDRNDGLCAPGTRSFVDWIQEVGHYLGEHCNASDVTALRSLYETARGDGWSSSEAWNTSFVLTEWFGVTADSLGHVVSLNLSRNGLSGRLPATLGSLTRMTELRVNGNELTGNLPNSLAKLDLRELHYGQTGLCYPDDESFRRWLGGVESHTGTGVACPPRSERDILVEIYDALGGPEWTNNHKWLTDAPLRDWHGVEVNNQGRVVALDLYQNQLRGAIPPVLGSLPSLVSLRLEGNGGLTGPIPPELGDLGNLENLNLRWNHLRATIPPELGNLTRLRRLDLDLARLRGSIPPEIGRLANLEYLSLSRNAVDEGALTGPIPDELGNLVKLDNLDLSENELTGPIPDELGNLGRMTRLDLSANELTGDIPGTLDNLVRLLHLDLRENSLTGTIPVGIGSLTRLSHMNLSDNQLAGNIPQAIGRLSELEYLWLERAGLEGPVPMQLGGVENLRELRLTGNAEMVGALPQQLTELRGLEVLLADGTALCVPGEAQFLNWLQSVPKRRISPCVQELPDAYLVQAVQSRDFPVPLVAGEPALLRVFVTSRITTNADFPPVRATFFGNGTERYTVTIPPKPGPMSTALYEGSLRQSANVEIPGWVISPGLEMIVEVDPDGTLDADLGVARRIPASGRMAVEVQDVPLLDLTLVPFIVTTDPDSSIINLTEAMVADPGNHEVLWGIRELMPVADLEVTAHAPVATATDNRRELLSQTELIRVAEGATGHYMGMLPYFVGGTAYLGGRSSFASPSPGLMAHEIGHNFNLLHAPCPPGINNPDPSYPHVGGRIGVWGYDSRDGGRLVPPTTSDVMGYCGYEWPGDYHFTNALSYRLFDETASSSSAVAARDKSLLVWGGVNAEGDLFLQPSFVMDAPPALPDSVGEYQLMGRSATGEELFALRFPMKRMADGEGSSSFVFALPVQPGWEENLASITLAGAGGSFTLDGESNLPMAILRDPRTGQVRGILRDLPPPTQTAADAVGQAAGQGLETLFSRGIPGATAWRR